MFDKSQLAMKPALEADLKEQGFLNDENFMWVIEMRQ